MTEQRQRPLIDLAELTRRFRITVVVALVVAVVSAVVGGIRGTGVVAGFFQGLVGVLVLAGVVLVALSALSGADRAQRRGERLSSDDVGLLPTRREQE